VTLRRPSAKHQQRREHIPLSMSRKYLGFVPTLSKWGLSSNTHYLAEHLNSLSFVRLFQFFLPIHLVPERLATAF
jgi:hypothetical protein